MALADGLTPLPSSDPADTEDRPPNCTCEDVTPGKRSAHSLGEEIPAGIFLGTASAFSTATATTSTGTTTTSATSTEHSAASRNERSVSPIPYLQLASRCWWHPSFYRELSQAPNTPAAFL
ncbi:hypothetical protein PoB_006506800 [Plakobranchus ocellatus]|uniref:Uncharacterized protein n=1 Tax=Plakobranchus ocellatus TaxID=259542 RepID=A0AAV4D319_9GAST|nr:hypothetical protein PoB_006506800 [Plakobranchus ocellatus]